MTLNEMFDKRAVLVTALEALDDRVGDLKKERQGLDEAIFAKLDAEGITSVKSAQHGTLSASEQNFASLSSERRDEALALAKIHIPDLVKEQVNSRTLAGWLKEARKNGQDIPAEFLALINETTKRVLSWRRGGKKK